MVSLRQMQYAVTLAETGHFGRAADRCHVTQPALSQQIRQLEEACGSALFDRLGKSVRPTPLGREFVDRARPILEQAEALDALLSGARGHPARPLRLGVIPTVAPYLLPQIFPALQREHPGMSFSVSESRTDALIEALTDGAIDLALIASEPRSGGPRLTSVPLFDDAFVLATGVDEEPRDPVPLDEIDQTRMLLLDEGHCFRNQTIAACGLDPEAAGHTFAATSLSTIVEFVANGQGITLLPEIALRKEATGDRIRIHRLQSPGAHRQLQLVWREATPFAEVFQDVAATIRRARPAPQPSNG
ncbi:hydrogen peroxide-inducible genes activator [Devosia sp.]|uniref:hydrogen peroxide-inducible genes activator n=1 Tax=Devosia sp. TaxID=1871048 RepID=UPI001AC6D4F0|nr:hydrogen peroxide-inducible genes activator [Devosia sp.]MBN9309897.1 LysR family transcriptional regulator [Devosia sp.]